MGNRVSFIDIDYLLMPTTGSARFGAFGGFFRFIAGFGASLTTPPQPIRHIVINKPLPIILKKPFPIKIRVGSVRRPMIKEPPRIH